MRAGFPRDWPPGIRRLRLGARFEETGIAGREEGFRARSSVLDLVERPEQVLGSGCATGHGTVRGGKANLVLASSSPVTTAAGRRPDESGAHQAVENHMHVRDLQRLDPARHGSGPRAADVSPAGREFRLTDVRGRVAREILA